MGKTGEILSVAGLFLSVVMLGFILFNTVRDFENGIEAQIRIVQEDVHEVNIKLAGVEAKLEVLISAWEIEMPESPSVAVQ